MTKYSALTKKRRMMVDLLLQEYPSIKETGVVSLKELRALHVKLWDARENGGLKIGYPLWLTIEQQYRTDVRGRYAVPLPTDTDVPTENSKEGLTTKKLERIIKSSEQANYNEEDFLAELADAGINV